MASRAEQIAEQSAELSTAVVPCRTWRGPFSQHDSAVQNGAILDQGPLDYKSKKNKTKEVSRINIQCKIINTRDWQRLQVEKELNPNPLLSSKPTQNVTSNSSGQKCRVGLRVMKEQNKSHEIFSGRGILNLCSKTNS